MIAFINKSKKEMVPKASVAAAEAVLMSAS